MLGDISRLEKIYIVCGYTDMRKSIDGLCAVIEEQLKMDPTSSALFLFCGRRRALLSDYSDKRAMDFSSCIKDLIMVHSDGQGQRMRQWQSQRISTGC